MVISLGPGKFYGTSLPRPRFYTDIKFNDHRVDPPLPVNDPLLSWAEEAHWSMGGLSFNRLRLQGKIEGNVERLRSQRKKQAKAQAQAQANSPIPPSRSDDSRSKPVVSPSPPPAPIATKRRRLTSLIEEEESIDVIRAATLGARKRRLVKKLGDDFDRVADSEKEDERSEEVGSESPDSVAVLKNRRRRLVKASDAVKKVSEEGEKSKSNPRGSKSMSEAEKSPVSEKKGARTSPRLAKK